MTKSESLEKLDLQWSDVTAPNHGAVSTGHLSYSLPNLMAKMGQELHLKKQRPKEAGDNRKKSPVLVSVLLL